MTFRPFINDQGGPWLKPFINDFFIIIKPGYSNHTWQLLMAADTNTLSYWLNWRFALCVLWVLTAMIGAATLIWKYEGFNKDKTQRRDNQRESLGCLYKDEAWRTCFQAIHPVWLLAFRIFSFTVLLALLVINVVFDGGAIFYFYTQWTFTLVSLYFGLGSSFSIYGCFCCSNEIDGDKCDCAGLDTERGTYFSRTMEENANLPYVTINSSSEDEPQVRQTAGIWGYVFQIIFQMCAGAVVLTDCVFWFVIYPFLTDDDYKLNFLIISMHSLNAVFLFGDMILNHLRFPFFRIAYFVQWTCIFVIFQWIIHACISIWWPYPFLDLSSPYAPLWYLGVGLLHLPCYGIIILMVRTKQACLSRLS